MVLLYSLGGGHHFLDERQGALLGEAHAHRAGKPYAGVSRAAGRLQLAKHSHNHIACVGVVPPVTGKKHFARITDGGHLDRC